MRNSGITRGLGAMLLAAATCAAPAVSAQEHSHDQVAQAQSDVSIGSTQINGPVSVLMGVGGFTGGNVAVSAGKDGILIVDSKLAPMSDKLQEKLAGMAVCQDCGDIRFLINTHWHYDHVGGNAAMADNTVIVAHDNVRKLMSADQTLDFFNKEIPAASSTALPVVTFADSVSIHFNGEEISVRHLPNGHTESDSIVYFAGSGVLHTGDIFFNGIFPFLDTQHGGDVKQLARNVEVILAEYPEDTVIIPGHGPVASMQDLRAYLHMLKVTTVHVEHGMSIGKDLASVKATGLPTMFDSWAWLIDQQGWITLVHNSLSANRATGG